MYPGLGTPGLVQSKQLIDCLPLICSNLRFQRLNRKNSTVMRKAQSQQAEGAYHNYSWLLRITRRVRN